jgi:3-oxoacyl-[acyl-carrier protein] reductase
VTGAGRGIGKAIAESLAAKGVTVICVSKSAASCGAVADAILAAGGKAKALAVDVADGAAVAAASEALLKEFGKIDILVNNAGITRDGLLARMSDDDWNSVIQTNLTSCFHWTKAIGWPMCRARFGRIVNISSVTGIMGNAGQVNYAAAKAGLVGMTKSIARELGSKGITANVVAPGFIETDMTAVLPPQVKEQALPNIPLKRFGTPTDIAAAIGWLTSDEGGYVTGQVIVVDGGMAM